MKINFQKNTIEKLPESVTVEGNTIEFPDSDTLGTISEGMGVAHFRLADDSVLIYRDGVISLSDHSWTELDDMEREEEARREEERFLAIGERLESMLRDWDRTGWKDLPVGFHVEVADLAEHYGNHQVVHHVRVRLWHNKAFKKPHSAEGVAALPWEAYVVAHAPTSNHQLYSPYVSGHLRRETIDAGGAFFTSVDYMLLENLYSSGEGPGERPMCLYVAQMLGTKVVASIHLRVDYHDEKLPLYVVEHEGFETVNLTFGVLEEN